MDELSRIFKEMADLTDFIGDSPFKSRTYRLASEAAKIDGAGQMRFLFEILIPLSKSTIGGIAMINFVYAWNLYLWPLVVTNSNNMATAQIGLKMLTNVESTSNWGVIMAGTLMVLGPTLILFFAVQKLFVRGIITTGLKE